jgi:hypothetical protein
MEKLIYADASPAPDAKAADTATAKAGKPVKSNRG